MSRILVATVPVPAHTRFPLPVVARLVERGHEVLWFASRRFHEDVAAVGATPVPYGATRDYDGARLLEEFPQLAGLHGPRAIGRAYSDVFVGQAPERVADLRAVVAATPVDALLADGLSYGVGLLGEALGIPTATLGDGPLVRAHGSTPAFGPGLLPMRGPLSRLRNHAVRTASRRWVFAQAQERYDALRHELGLAPDGRTVLEASVSPMLHLQACTPSFEYPVVDLPPTVHWIGALRPDLPQEWVAAVVVGGGAHLVAPGRARDPGQHPARHDRARRPGAPCPGRRGRARRRDDRGRHARAGGAGARGTAAGQRARQRVRAVRPAPAARRRLRHERRVHRRHDRAAPRRAAGPGRFDGGEGGDRRPGPVERRGGPDPGDEAQPAAAACGGSRGAPRARVRRRRGADGSRAAAARRGAGGSRARRAAGGHGREPVTRTAAPARAR